MFFLSNFYSLSKGVHPNYFLEFGGRLQPLQSENEKLARGRFHREGDVATLDERGGRRRGERKTQNAPTNNEESGNVFMAIAMWQPSSVEEEDVQVRKSHA